MKDLRLAAAVATFAALTFLAAAGVAEAHRAPRFYVPQGYIQDTPVGVIDQFHEEDLAAMLEEGPQHAAEHLAMMEAAGLPWSKHRTRLLTEMFSLPKELVRIASCESLHDPSAVGKTDDWGLFQIHGKWVDEWGLPPHIAATRDHLLDPYRNAAAAAYIYDIQGLRAWVCWAIINGR